MNKVPRWVFRYVGNKTFDFSSKNQDFCPKTTKFGIFARPCQLIWCPVGGLVGGCGARAVFRKTPIYFIYFRPLIRSKIDSLSYLLSPKLSSTNTFYNLTSKLLYEIFMFYSKTTIWVTFHLICDHGQSWSFERTRENVKTIDISN